MGSMHVQFVSATEREEREEATELGDPTRMLRVRSSSRSVRASCDLGSERRSSIGFCKPHLAFRQAALRPRPPNPPVIVSCLRIEAVRGFVDHSHPGLGVLQSVLS